MATVLGNGKLLPLWKFLTFTQNFGLAAGTDFSHAWSLCIEEQFYLLLPAVSIFVLRKFSIKGAWIVLAVALIAGVATRSVLWLHYGADGVAYYKHIYYSSFCRADEFLPGIAIALVKNFHPNRWERLKERGTAFSIAGIGAVIAMFYGFLNFYTNDDGAHCYFMTGFGYSLMAIAFAILTIGALSPKSFLNRVQIPGAAQLALGSYAIYLTHKPIANIVGRLLASRNMDLNAYPAVLAVVGACLFGGAALYFLVETPFMRLRDRLVLSLWKQQP